MGEKYKDRLNALKSKILEYRDRLSEVEREKDDQLDQARERHRDLESIIERLHDDMKVIKQEWESRVCEVENEGQRRLLEEKSRLSLTWNATVNEVTHMIDSRLLDDNKFSESLTGRSFYDA